MADYKVTKIFTAVASGAQNETITLSDPYQQYIITSGGISYTAADSLTITLSGTPYYGMKLEIVYAANITLANHVDAKIVFTDGGSGYTIKGDGSGNLPAIFSKKRFILTAVYNGSTWVYNVLASADNSDIINNASISEIAGITPAKLALAEGSVIVGNSSTVGVALDASTDGYIMVGNGTTITSVAVSGDITLTNAGVTAIATGVIVNADINASAAIAFSKLAPLTSGNILVGSAGNVATSVAMSGDVTIDNAGATTIQADSVENSMMADDSVSLTNLDSTGQLDSATTTSPTGANTTETTLASFAIPTGAMDADGETVDIFAYGSFANTATVKTVRLRMGATLATSTLLAANTTTGSPQNINWCIRAKIFRTGAAAQKGNAEIIFSGIATELDNFTATETWSSSTLYLAGLNGTANAADIVLEGWEVITNKENNA